MKKSSNKCSAEIGSLTQAMRAQEALAYSAIPSSIIKAPSPRHRGCIYGVSFSCAQESNVRTILSGAKIPFGQISSEDNI